jgi:hypothetical protein
MSDHHTVGVYLIVDRENGAVVCSTPTAYHATTLANELINCGGLYVRPDLNHANYNFNDYSINYQYFIQSNEFTVLDAVRTPDNWTQFRKQIIDRLNALFTLDFLAKTRTAFVENFYNMPMFTAILATELEKCNVEKNIYSPAIEEWASLQSVSPEIAYKELKITYTDISMTYIRNHAIYLNFAKQINQTEGADNLRKVLDAAKESFIICF